RDAGCVGVFPHRPPAMDGDVASGSDKVRLMSAEFQDLRGGRATELQLDRDGNGRVHAARQPDGLASAEQMSHACPWILRSCEGRRFHNISFEGGVNACMDDGRPVWP